MKRAVITGIVSFAILFSCLPPEILVRDSVVEKVNDKSFEMVSIPAADYTYSNKYGVLKPRIYLTNEYFLAKHEMTNEIAYEVFSWALENDKCDVVSESEEGRAVLLHYKDIPLFVVNYRPFLEKQPAGKKYFLSDNMIYMENGQLLLNKDYANYPITGLTWHGAILMCNWLTEMTSSAADVCYDFDEYVLDITYHSDRTGFRLPIVQEWLNASVYNDGEDAEDICRVSGGIIDSGARTLEMPYYSWCIYDKPDSYPMFEIRLSSMGGVYGLHETGLKYSNKLGLYDMNGNAAEFLFGYCIYKYEGSSFKYLYHHRDDNQHTANYSWGDLSIYFDDPENNQVSGYLGGGGFDDGATSESLQSVKIYTDKYITKEIQKQEYTWDLSDFIDYVCNFSEFYIGGIRLARNMEN